MGFDSPLVQNLILWPTIVHFYSIQISKYLWSPFICELLQKTQTEVIYILKIIIHIKWEITMCQSYYKTLQLLTTLFFFLMK